MQKLYKDEYMYLDAVTAWQEALSWWRRRRSWSNATAGPWESFGINFLQYDCSFPTSRTKQYELKSRMFSLKAVWDQNGDLVLSACRRCDSLLFFFFYCCISVIAVFVCRMLWMICLTTVHYWAVASAVFKEIYIIIFALRRGSRGGTGWVNTIPNKLVVSFFGWCQISF